MDLPNFRHDLKLIHSGYPYLHLTGTCNYGAELFLSKISKTKKWKWFQRLLILFP